MEEAITTLTERAQRWLLKRRTERALNQIGRAIMRQRTGEMQRVVREARELGLVA